MKREINLFEKSLLYTVPLSILIAMVVYAITLNDNNQIQGITVGTVLSLILNFLHVYLTRRISENNPVKLKSFTICSYIIRYLIYGALILLGALYLSINPIFAIIAVVEYPIMLMILSFVTNK